MPRGLDIDLARAFAKADGRDVVFVRTSWPTLMTDLHAGAFDVALSGIAVTEGRAAMAEFSSPYYHGNKVAVIRCSEQTRFKNMTDFDKPNVRVLYNPGGTNEVFARSNLPNADLDVEANNPLIFERIAGNEADVFFTDSVEAVYYTYHRKVLCRAMVDANLAPFEIAAMALPGSPTLQRFDRWLRLPASTLLVTTSLKEHLHEAP